MVLMSDVPEPLRARIADLDCPGFETAPYVSGPPLHERRIALVSSAGLMQRGAKPFRGGDHHYLPIAHDAEANELLISHLSVNFDRTGFQQDHNVMLPRERLAELRAEGAIGDFAQTHYSFMGATDPRDMEADARELAQKLMAADVSGVALIPV